MAVYLISVTFGSLSWLSTPKNLEFHQYLGCIRGAAIYLNIQAAYKSLHYGDALSRNTVTKNILFIQ